MVRGSVLLFIFFFFSGLTTAQQKRIYIAPDNHTDFMWTATDVQYNEAFLEMLDYYIQLNEKTSQHPYPYQSKWNCDGSFWVYTYEKNRNADQFEKLIGQIKDGKITVPLNTLNGLHGIAPTEAAIREMYYAGSLEKRYNLDLNLAFNMEDHVLPLGLSSIWAGAGARFSWHGVCHCATKVEGLYSRPHEFYWYTGIDGRRVLMKWQSLTADKQFNQGYSNQFPGGYAEAFNPAASVKYYKSIMGDSTKYPYDIASAFGTGWDNLKITTDEFVAVARELSDSGYQVIVSNEIDFFTDFEENYGATLPVETLSYGGTEWGYGVASLAEVSASVKRSMEKLRAAEAMHTLVALKDKSFASELGALKEKAWIACGLYFEHDWTADSPVITQNQRASWQRKIENELGAYVDSLHALALIRLGEMIPGSRKSDDSFYVFNPLGWSRTDYCDYPYEGSSAIRVTDIATAKDVPFQLIDKENKHWIRILADEIPPLGFKTYRIEERKEPTVKGVTAKFSGNIAENEYYRITISPKGSILSLIDKKNNNRECIKALDGLHSNDLGSVTDEVPVSIQVENPGPVSVTLLARSGDPLDHSSRITLFSQIDRIDIENHITQNFGADPVTYSFSFNVKTPEIWHEEVGAVIRAAPRSSGGHYAESHCRLDWLPINHFVSVSDPDFGMVLSNRDAYFMKVGNSDIKSLDISTPQIHVLAGGQIDADLNLGIKNQDGDSSFTNSFALTTHQGPFKALAAMKFSLEHQNPLVSGSITGGTPYYENQFSLFAISDPNVLIWAVKPAEEGITDGIILRVWNMGDRDSNCTISSRYPIANCFQTTHIERNESEIIVSEGEAEVTIRHNGLQTFRLYLGEKANLSIK